jgi:hypothetical protein
MTYSFSDLENLWIQAGGSRNLAGLMAAIGLAESAGDPNAVNASTNSTGLWQINPVHIGEPGINWANITDPLTNAKAAVAVYNQQGLSAWEAYTNGSYQQFLGLGGSAGAGPAAGSAPSPAGSGPNLPEISPTLGTHLTRYLVYGVAFIVLIIAAKGFVFPSRKAAT